MTEQRLQKVLACAGIGSRRFAEGLIEAGRVRVDGRIVTELGTKVDAERVRVEVDGRRLVRQPPVYLLLHKPRGVVSTVRDPEGRPTVAALVSNVGARVLPVGRLDYASSGVLVMTNDGDFTAKLVHPSGGAKKLYHVKVRGMVNPGGLERWRRSIDIDGHRTRPAEVRILEVLDGKTWLEICLHEGRNRQIRRLGDVAGYPVLRLVRVAYAGLTVDSLRPGQWRYLTKDELLELKKQFGVPRRLPPFGIGAIAPNPAKGVGFSKSKTRQTVHRATSKVQARSPHAGTRPAPPGTRKVRVPSGRPAKRSGQHGRQR